MAGFFDIIIRTMKQGDAKATKQDLSELKDGFAGLVEGMTGLNLTSLGTAGALAGIGAGLKKAVDSGLEYAEQVRDLSRISGAGAEATSRLIQTADDLAVSYSTLEQAAKSRRRTGSR